MVLLYKAKVDWTQKQQQRAEILFIVPPIVRTDFLKNKF